MRPQSPEPSMVTCVPLEGGHPKVDSSSSPGTWNCCWIVIPTTPVRNVTKSLAEWLHITTWWSWLDIAILPLCAEHGGATALAWLGMPACHSTAAWYGRFIRVTDPDDLNLLTLWTVHTHLVVELYTTPRLQVDSVIFGSGKTTMLDHLQRLCENPVQAATLSSPALIPRLLESAMRTLLLDEVDRSLHPDKPGVGELIGIINSGYRYGATRPVLVPVKGGGWEAREMSTYAPVVMAGNSPNLPSDTVSRSIRILLMPDLDGTVEDSDWELIEGDAERLRADIVAWADSVRQSVKGSAVVLPAGCIGRSKEKWRPLKRVAVAAGGDWPAIVDRLINKESR